MTNIVFLKLKFGAPIQIINFFLSIIFNLFFSFSTYLINYFSEDPDVNISTVIGRIK